jgi:hypothetical protein
MSSFSSLQTLSGEVPVVCHWPSLSHRTILYDTVPPPVGRTSSNGAHALFLAKAIVCSIVFSCHGWGTIPNTVCMASTATEGRERSASVSMMSAGCWLVVMAGKKTALA